MQVTKGQAMHGTILIVDGVSTNRIMLKVQLSAAWYHVVQADRLDGLEDLIRRTQPDLVLAAMTLPDGSALDLPALLARCEAGSTPVIAITDENDRAARLRALEAGIDDVLSQPLADVILQARIRSLLRARQDRDDLKLPPDLSTPGSSGGGSGGSGGGGLREAAAGFDPAPQVARVALVARDLATATRWKVRLQPQVPHRLSCHAIGDGPARIHGSAPGANGAPERVPDVIVVQIDQCGDDSAQRLLADLRARAATRNTVVIGVADPADQGLAAEALDLGAHDVVSGGFCAEELALRIARQRYWQARSARLRSALRDGLRAAMRDPLTGLYNRRYALPFLADTARRAARDGTGFAVMLADLDHFKSVNDRFGHGAGDAALVEAARRMTRLMRAQDLLARIGGEEFLIVLPQTDIRAARVRADALRRQIQGAPLIQTGPAGPVHLTISIGVAICPPGIALPEPDAEIAGALMERADRALYQAKHAGRNRVSFRGNAA